MPIINASLTEWVRLKQTITNMKDNMRDKKFELTDVTKKVGGVVLHQIKALKDFGDVTAGDLGGFVEHEFNLSQKGDCWVYHNAAVYGNAVIFENACVFDHATVNGFAMVFGNARIHDSAVISVRAKVHGHANIMCCAHVFDDANIGDFAVISGHASVFGSSFVLNRALVTDNAKVSEGAKISDMARINQCACVRGSARVYGTALICGYSTVEGVVEISDSAVIRGDAVVGRNEDFLFFRNNFSSYRGVTWTRSNDKWSTGCFLGTGLELIEKAKNDYVKKALFYANYVLLVESLKDADFLRNSVYEHRLRLVEERLSLCRKWKEVKNEYNE